MEERRLNVETRFSNLDLLRRARRTLMCATPAMSEEAGGTARDADLHKTRRALWFV